MKSVQIGTYGRNLSYTFTTKSMFGWYIHRHAEICDSCDRDRSVYLYINLPGSQYLYYEILSGCSSCSEFDFIGQWWPATWIPA